MPASTGYKNTRERIKDKNWGVLFKSKQNYQYHA